MRLNNKNFVSYIPAGLWIIAVFVVYLPLLKDGGIIIDDWGGIASNFECTSIFDACFKERYANAFYTVFANRPLAPLPIVLSTVLFKTHFTWYLYLNTSLLLAAILIVSWIINKLVGQIPALIFAYMAIIPVISMPLVVSPINLMDSTFAYLCWAISLYLLYGYCLKKSYLAYFLSYFLLICGFFTYEVFLPLLVMNLSTPYLLNLKLGKKFQIYIYFWKYVAPLIFVLFVVYLYQKVIGPNFFQFQSRLNFSWGNILPSFTSWINIFFYDLPLLFLKARKFLSPVIVISAMAFTACIYSSFKLFLKNVNLNNSIYHPFFYVTTLCFFSTSFILILSGAKADIGAYEARALSSTWIGFSLFCSGLSVFFYEPSLFSSK